MALSKKQREVTRAASEQRKAARVFAKQDAQKTEQWKQETARLTLARYKPKRHNDGGEVAAMVARIAPRLLDSTDYARAIGRMEGPYFRRPDDLSERWEPHGKGRETLFRSLCTHLYAKFPTPPFMWSVFFEEDLFTREPQSALVKRLASGASFYEEVKTERFPVPLTRKMCHEVLKSPAEFVFLDAVRRVQVRAAGGSDLLWKAWSRTSAGRSLGSPADEKFWATVIHWLAQNPMLDRAQVGPLVDYIIFRRNQDPEFSMKGRSATTFFAAMLEWHGDLQKVKASAGQVFEPSGFKEAVFDFTRPGKVSPVVEIWRIKEILTGKDLAHEGRANKHCVYSYAESIEKKHSSIWSMTYEDTSGNWHAITIEVRNAARRIVQARGTFNRKPTGPESNILRQWADQNSLTISPGV